MAMCVTRRCRVRGSLPARFVQRRRIKTSSSGYSRHRSSHNHGMHFEPDHKIDDFMLYSEPDEEEEEEETEAQADEGLGFDDGGGDGWEVGGHSGLAGHQQQQRADAASASRNSVKPFAQRCLPVSYNVTDYVVSRSVGLTRHEHQHVSEEYGTRHMLTTGMFKEYPVMLQRQPLVDKVFCSQWLSSDKIIMGTKCNKLKVYDINTHKMIDIPQLSHPTVGAAQATPSHGVYSIEMNPSRTLLATVGETGRDPAVYRLPYLDPVCLGHKGHTDSILDFCWLDDVFLVSGGMDRRMALWRIDDFPDRSSAHSATDDDDEESFFKPLPAVAPLRLKKCIGADKVRAVIFNSRNSEIVALSTNAFLHVWDPERFYQKMSRKLPHAMENVCLTQRHDSSLYAVGSKSHFTLLDPRTLHHVKKVSARINGCSVKSLSFHCDVLTIGTAGGVILFYDMKAGKYMESTMNSGRAVTLKCSRGFLNPEAMELMPNVDYSPTIYTHCYDHSGTRLFAAGGPLAITLRGHYAGIWR